MSLWGWLTGDRPGPPQPDGGAPSLPEPTSAAHGARGTAASWRQLPAIQRVVGGITPNAQAENFAGSLSTWRNPSLVGESDHGVSPLAPSGLVSGLAEPVPPAR